jgi:Ni/Co efflux regulator RcnB
MQFMNNHTMSSRLTVLAAAALGGLLALSAPAQAQPRDDQPMPRHEQPAPRHGQGGPDGMAPMRNPGPAARQPAPPAAKPQHRAEGPRFEVGRPVPNDYRGRNYRVDRWQDHHLPRPGRGQHWAQHGTDYLLINASGIVVQIVRP